jgi:hypothetical protein
MTPLAYLDRTHEVLHITDLATDPAYDRHDRRVVALVESARARTVVIVPMFKENALVGAMAIYRAAVRPFTDKQIALVQNFAAQAVIAIENARLLDELRQRTADLSESLEQQTATSEVLKVISSSPGALAPVFNAIAEPVPGFFAEHGGARTQRIASSIANATAQANALSYTIAHDLSIIVVVLLANVGCALKKPARAPMK